MNKIPWWHTEVGQNELDSVLVSFRNRCFSMGCVTAELEKIISSILGVPYVVITNSGTSALTMALLAADICPGDEVIVPDLTWIATAQAVSVLGARVVLVDCCSDLPLIDVEEVKKKITKNTKAIIPVHLNGRACNMSELKSIVKGLNITLIEDACKAFASRTSNEYLGTIGDMGCFSFSMISFLSMGYGGAVVTSSEQLYNKLKLIRDHGVQRQPEVYRCLGFNFKVSDVLSAIGLAKISKLQENINHVTKLYKCYEEGLRGIPFIRIIPVDTDSGKVPLMTDFCSEHREEIIGHLLNHGVMTSKFHLPLHRATYLKNDGTFPNATRFSNEGFILPSGPSQSIENVNYCIKPLREWCDNKYNSIKEK